MQKQASFEKAANPGLPGTNAYIQSRQIASKPATPAPAKTETNSGSNDMFSVDAYNRAINEGRIADARMIQRYNTTGSSRIPQQKTAPAAQPAAPVNKEPLSPTPATSLDQPVTTTQGNPTFEQQMGLTPGVSLTGVNTAQAANMTAPQAAPASEPVKAPTIDFSRGSMSQADLRRYGRFSAAKDMNSEQDRWAAAQAKALLNAGVDRRKLQYMISPEAYRKAKANGTLNQLLPH